MKKKIDEAARTIVFTFDGLEPVIFHTSAMSSEVTDYAILHGMSARLGDTAASCKTEAERRAAVAALAAHYASGAKEWNVRAPAKAAATATENPVIAAIAARLGVTYAEAQAKVAEQFLADLAG